MDIKLLCPMCHNRLTEKFNAEFVCVIVGKVEVPLQMECLKCGKYVDVKLITPFKVREE